MSLTKYTISKYLFDTIGLGKKESKDLISLFFEEIRLTLESGEQVRLSGFGNFDLRKKNLRLVHNPKKGNKIPVKNYHVVNFKAGKKLKLRIKSGGEIR